jgi:branched-chain amino acid transport system permease protein
MKQVSSRLHVGKMPIFWLAILIALPFIVKNIYYLHLANAAIILIILTVGLNLLTGYAGQISIGHAAFYGIGAYASAFMTVRLGWSFWVALPLSGLLCSGIGYLIGKPTLKLRGAYLAIASIGVGEITRLVLINWSQVTGGAEGFKGIPSPILFKFALDSDFRYYWLLASILVVVYFFANRLIDSEIGRAFRAIREEEIAAEFMGADTANLKVRVFMISTFLAGIAGCLMAHMDGYLSPFSFNFTQSVAYLMMALAGGLGSKWGPIVGVLLLTYAKEAFRFFNDYQLVIYGLLLVLLIVFMPKGVCGSIKDLYLKLTGSRGKNGR